MASYAFPILAMLIICARCDAFQTSQMLPLRVDPIPKHEICDRLGLKEADDALSIGSGPNMGYSLTNEHEVLCPISGAHQGVLCTAILSEPIDGSERADSIADNHELVSQAILAGSLAASIRNRCRDGNSLYYLPFIITLVESLMADEMVAMDWAGERVFNGGGLETNEILMDLGDDDDGLQREGEGVMLYACNTSADHNSATSDVYVLPKEKKGKVWRFSVDFKVTTINLRQIPCFGNRDSTTPLRPDVWLKDDSY